ncbi:MAG: hypothetical protein RUMPE_01142 [Eubacteriales bacterium SKADARSKE-1]|nr:hypothetical protein [Eubacteriales bacterium SKADARSKE-1]
MHDVTINLATATYSESVFIKGFFVPGAITINGGAGWSASEPYKIKGFAPEENFARINLFGVSDYTVRSPVVIFGFKHIILQMLIFKIVIRVLQHSKTYVIFVAAK